ncbi:MAG: RNA polymerase sigma factor [Myxococcaceae bacterium]
MSEPIGRPLQVVGDPATPSDEALCRAFLEGDGGAFGELVRRHQELVFLLVRRYAQDSTEAKDLCQRAFLRAFEAARRSLPRTGKVQPVPFRAWLLRVALNLAKNQARQRRRWREGPADALRHAPSPSVAAPEALARAEQERQVKAAVLSLPHRQREVLTLRVDGALSFAEVGEALGITPANAKVHFGLAVKRLKAVLSSDAPKETP